MPLYFSGHLQSFSFLHLRYVCFYLTFIERGSICPVAVVMILKLSLDVIRTLI